MVGGWDLGGCEVEGGLTCRVVRGEVDEFELGFGEATGAVDALDVGVVED